MINKPVLFVTVTNCALVVSDALKVEEARLVCGRLMAGKRNLGGKHQLFPWDVCFLY